MGRKDREKKKRQRLNRLQQKERRKALIGSLKPLLWAFIAWFVLNTILHLPGIRDAVEVFFVSFTTHSAYWFGKVLFMPIEMTQVPFLSVNGFNMRVVMECTAYTFYLFAFVLVLFARWPLRHKLSSLGLILLGIFIINNMRFISMGYLGSYRPDLFDLVHDIVWNVLFGFMVFGLWAWRELTAGRKVVGKQEHEPMKPGPC